MNSQTNEVSVPVNDLLKLIENIIKYPYGKICKHHTATELLQVMVRNGWKCPTDLAEKIINGEDKTALKLLKKQMEN